MIRGKGKQQREQLKLIGETITATAGTIISIATATIITTAVEKTTAPTMMNSITLKRSLRAVDFSIVVE